MTAYLSAHLLSLVEGIMRVKASNLYVDQ